TRAGPGLGELLRHAGTEGESAVNQALRQAGHGLVGALAEYLAPDALGERDTVVDAHRPLPVEQVRRVHGMPSGAKLPGGRAHPVGEPLRVVEQYDFGHLYTPAFLSRAARPCPSA